MKYIGGTKLDERVIRTDLDPGFQEGRQYGYVMAISFFVFGSIFGLKSWERGEFVFEKGWGGEGCWCGRAFIVRSTDLLTVVCCVGAGSRVAKSATNIGTSMTLAEGVTGEQ